MSFSNIAVFIDGDSINSDCLGEIIKEIHLYGNIFINNIYADWSYLSKKQLLIKSRNCGITTIQSDLINNKNSTYTKLSIDVIRTLYMLPYIDTFYLVVCDYDYRHIIPEIKKYGKKVCCIGTEKTNISLINICDNFTLIKNIINKGIKESIIQLIESSNKDINLNIINNMLKRIYKFDIRNTNSITLKQYMIENYNDIITISNCSKAIVKLK